MTAEDIRFDVTPAVKVLALWPRDSAATETPHPAASDQRKAALRIATGPGYRTLRAFQSEQNRCFMTDPEVQRALLYPDSPVCGIWLAPAFRIRGALDSLLDEMARRGPALREAIAARADRYLPPRSWAPVPIFVVVSSPLSFDAATLPEAGVGRPAVIVNATDVLPYAPTAREQVDVLQHVLAHETFHAGIQQMERSAPGWAGYGLPPRSANAYIARVLLDEGVAHYIDWRDRAGSDTLFTKKPGPREKHAFAQLALASKRLSERTDPGFRDEVVQLAASGPLWSKYGAISGMFAAYRIESRLGVDSLRAAIVGGPRVFLRMYAGVAAADTSLGRVPAEFAK
ncbi:MAG: DUF5700 domain-containing putative Zn-dependent protease [Bacteroidota bacterium]